MFVSGGGASAESTAVVGALRRQLAGLSTLALELGTARTVLPAARGDRVWSGVAHRRYLAALESLAVELAAAARRVDDAIDETERALSTLGSRVG